jgi:hypothetical protein
MVFFGLPSKSMATVFSGLTLKSVATIFFGLASKPVATISPVLASKHVTWVSRFGPQNRQLWFGDLGHQNHRNDFLVCVLKLSGRWFIGCALKPTGGGRDGTCTRRNLKTCFTWMQDVLGFSSLS